MKTMKKVIGGLAVGFAALLLLSSFGSYNLAKAHFTLPYKQAGLTERQAAAHLLSRLTYGARPGDIDRVVKMGLENWMQQQLDAKVGDDSLNQALNTLDAINLSNSEVVSRYPKAAQILKMAIKDGVVDKDAVNKTDKSSYKATLTAYMQQNGLRPQQELFRQFISQKILRAAYTNNQLQEVMTDFWFNHFNVSLTKNTSAEFIPAYERDVIRPNALGRFEDILIATAKSPAMLTYLDNFTSTGVNQAGNTVTNAPNKERVTKGLQMRMSENPLLANRAQKVQQNRKTAGLNENYAREVMELHTLGVDGGYTQNDVTEAARVLTGWTVYPMGEYGGAAVGQMVAKIGEENLKKRGFVHQGDFLFTPNRHDTGSKVVLGKKFEAGGGYEEGEELLRMLAHHSSTAKFISKKIATRFVSDNPPATLISKMARTFDQKNGDIRQVLITMISSPEFWSPEAVREKTKSPLDLVISAVRSVDAKIAQPYQLFSWMDKMGQKMYYYQAPTGFPDRGQYWINTGSLLNRMNFGLAFASQRIPGIKFNLAALNNNHEPESSEAALATYCKIIMPERDLDATIKRLKPMLNDPELTNKVNEAAGKAVLSTPKVIENEDAMIEAVPGNKSSVKGGKKGLNPKAAATKQVAAGNNAMLSQVVGIIIGSPEFQRK